MSFFDSCLLQDYALLEKYKTQFNNQTPNHFYTSDFFSTKDAQTILKEWPSAEAPWKTSQPLINFGVGRKSEINDLKDMGVKPSDYKIATKGFLAKQGVDPFNSENWKSGVQENMKMDMTLKMEGELGEPDFQKKAEGGDGVYEETEK